MKGVFFISDKKAILSIDFSYRYYFFKYRFEHYNKFFIEHYPKLFSNFAATQHYFKEESVRPYLKGTLIFTNLIKSHRKGKVAVTQSRSFRKSSCCTHKLYRTS